MLVSAIMPTGDRPTLAPLALECFLRQTWPEKELIVFDDGANSMAAIFEALEQQGVRYQRIPQKLSLGEKRNAAVRFARGEIVIHWDDDDWSAPTRMEDQVRLLYRSGKSLTGYHRIYYWDALQERAFRYRFTGPGHYAVGSSQCYVRTWGLAHPFPAKSYGEDTDFSHAAELLGALRSVDGARQLVARVHGANTGQPALGGRGFPAVSRDELPVQFFADLAAIRAGVCTPAGGRS